VNEAYLRMVNQSAVNWQNRAHFFGVSAQVMRNILIDMARKRLRRGGDAHHVSLDEALIVSEERAGELLSLDDALTALGKLDERKGRIVEVRYFGGLSVEETAEVLKVSPTTVDREWTRTRGSIRRCRRLNRLPICAATAGSDLRECFSNQQNPRPHGRGYNPWRQPGDSSLHWAEKKPNADFRSG
jgi:RNA polymerase sigma factor (sigma-70 family)